MSNMCAVVVLSCLLALMQVDGTHGMVIAEETSDVRRQLQGGGPGGFNGQGSNAPADYYSAGGYDEQTDYYYYSVPLDSNCEDFYDLCMTSSVRCDLEPPWPDFVSCEEEKDFCSEHPDTLQLYCAKTCGTCDCVDFYDQCKESSVPCQLEPPWEDFVSCADEAQYCDEHPETLQLYCAKTCGKCEYTGPNFASVFLLATETESGVYEITYATEDPLGDLEVQNCDLTDAYSGIAEDSDYTVSIGPSSGNLIIVGKKGSTIDSTEGDYEFLFYVVGNVNDNCRWVFTDEDGNTVGVELEIESCKGKC